MPRWAQMFVIAAVLVVVGWLIGAYLPLHPLDSVLSILFYVAAVIAALVGVLDLVRSPRV